MKYLKINYLQHDNNNNNNNNNNKLYQNGSVKYYHYANTAQPLKYAFKK